MFQRVNKRQYIKVRKQKTVVTRNPKDGSGDSMSKQKVVHEARNHEFAPDNTNSQRQVLHK